MKTSYFGKSANIPGAVSIARYAPKFYTGQQYQKLAPPSDIIKITDMSKYSTLYRLRVLAKLDAEVVYNELVDLAYPYEPVLLCYEKNIGDCHRGIVAQWFSLCLGIDVPEIGVRSSSYGATISSTRGKTKQVMLF